MGSLSLSPSLSDRMGKRGERGRIQGERMALPAGHPFVSVRPSFRVSSLPPWLGWRWRWVVIKTKEGELRNGDANARNVIDVPRAARLSVGPSVPPSVRASVRPSVSSPWSVRSTERGRRGRASAIAGQGSSEEFPRKFRRRCRRAAHGKRNSFFAALDADGPTDLRTDRRTADGGTDGLTDMRQTSGIGGGTVGRAGRWR